VDTSPTNADVTDQKTPSVRPVSNDVSNQEKEFLNLIADAGPFAKRVIIGILGHERVDDADDVFQIGLHKAWTKRGTQRDKGTVKNWFIKVFKHAALDWLRSRRRKEKQIYTPQEESQRFWNELIDSEQDSDPSAALISKEIGENILNAVGSLSEENRSVFVLAYIENLKESQIKQQLHISTAMVRKRKFAARTELKHKLAPHFRCVAHHKPATK
jgi:RNA polymerase sigma factor (sigma-70 family)